MIKVSPPPLFNLSRAQLLVTMALYTADDFDVEALLEAPYKNNEVNLLNTKWLMSIVFFSKDLKTFL